MEVSVVRPVESSPVPDPRSGHRCVADDSNLYVFGGYSPYHEGKLFRELWRFNFLRKSWEQLETTGPCPSQVASSSVLLDRGSMIVFGGSGVPFGQSNSDKLHVCLLKYKTWTEISHNVVDLPLAGYGQCMVLSPERDLYVFSGTTGHDFHSHLFRFNFFSRKWSSVRCEKPPVPRYRHEGVTHGGNLYVIGGGMGSRDPVEYFSLHNIPYFNFSNNSWKYQLCQPSRNNGYPNRRRCHGCVLYQSTVYICGGFDGESMFDDIWSLDLNTFHWEKLQKGVIISLLKHFSVITMAEIENVLSLQSCVIRDTTLPSQDTNLGCIDDEIGRNFESWKATENYFQLILYKTMFSFLAKYHGINVKRHSMDTLKSKEATRYRYQYGPPGRCEICTTQTPQFPTNITVEAVLQLILFSPVVAIHVFITVHHVHYHIVIQSLQPGPEMNVFVN